MITGETA
ncbi:Protein of unknown function [Bacillus cereus]|nr:Protein of unknown function [Bacillus cereus]